ncbi:hypothetical protein D3C80_1873470 [compost metagenome]
MLTIIMPELDQQVITGLKVLFNIGQPALFKKRFGTTPVNGAVINDDLRAEVGLEIFSPARHRLGFRPHQGGSGVTGNV